MDRLPLLACQVGGGLAILYVAWCVWTSLLLLTTVIVLVTLLYYYVESRCDVILPGDGKVVFITGCDTGIGNETAVAASQRGLTVVAGCINKDSAGAKRLADLPRVHVVEVDVTNDKSIDAAVQKLKSLCEHKGLWAIVNNAGFNQQAPVELTSMTTFQRVADVMLFGTVRVTKAFLPLLRQAKGRVVTMSSDRGMLSPAKSAAYCMAKHGIETFSDVLRSEMEPFSVSVSIIQPGHFGAATAIIQGPALEAMRSSLERDLAECSQDVQQTYGGTQAVDDVINTSIASRASSAKDVGPVVKAILHAVLSGHPRHRYAVHGTTGRVDWGIVLGQTKSILPDAAFKFIQSIAMRK